MKKLAVLAIAGLISVTASAANWVLVQQGYSGTDYVDTDSITSIYLDNNIFGSTYNRKSYKQAFIKTNYNEPQKAGSHVYTTVINLRQFDCESNPKKSRIISVLVRNDSDAVASYNYSNPDWDIHYPETIGEAKADFVCSYQK